MVYQVSGTVVSTNPEYFACLINENLSVQTFEVAFGSEPTYIQSATVNNDGTFSDEVTSTSNVILVRLYLTEGTTPILLAESQKYCHHEKVDVQFKIDESKFGDTVYNKIISRIDALGTTVDLTTLTDAQIEELSCLICVTEKTLERVKKAHTLWDTFAAMVPFTLPDDYSAAAAAALAFVNDPDTSTATERGRKLFFALLDNKPGVNVEEPFLHSPEPFGTLISQAAAKNEVESSLYTIGNVNYLVGSRNALLLNSNDDGRYYDGKIIHLSDNSYTDKSNLLNSSLDEGGLMGIPTPDGPDTHLAEALKVKELSDVLLNYAPFLDAFITARGRDINYFELTSAGPGDLETLITSAGTLPSGYPDAASYAGAIYDGLGSGNPSGRMVYALSGAGTSIPSGGDISDLLTANQDFNVREHSAEVYFTTDVGQPNTISETLMSDLLTLQRTSKLSDDTTNLDMSATLIGLDLTSSSAIVNMGESAFLQAMDGIGTVSSDTANGIFARARGVNETAIMMAMNYLRYEGPNSLMPRSLRGDITLPGGALPSNLPDMQKLFGSFNTCTCEECQSVYGAAAYLTDLLNWLRKDVKNPSGSINGLMALETMSTFDRRKDIRYLKLTCKNTNTLLPYIDIVNEILSVELLYDAGATGTDVLNARKSLQTIKTTEEIMTEPEHRFTSAEGLLKTIFYTWVLPYNVAYDEVLSYTRTTGMEYNEIVTALSSSATKYDEIRWARTVLNIHPEELALYTGVHYTSTTFWLDYYGFGSLVTVPPYVGPVLNVTGLSITDLKKELNAFYINGTSNITVVPTEDLCNVDNYSFSPSFTAAIAERFMKFFRLRRKTGLSIWELDVAIATFDGGSGIDDSLLNKLAAAVQFSKDYQVDFGDVMVMMGDNAYMDLITTSPAPQYSEYYKKKFLNPLLPAPIITFFTSGIYSATVTALTNEQKNYISAVIKVSIPAIDEIITSLGLSGTVTTTMLATIHRHALLLNVFGLKHTERASAISYFGSIYTATNKIKKALEFGQSLYVFGKLRTPLLTFADIANGTGDYDLSSVKLIAKAEKSWKSTEKAFQEARKANPDKDATDPIWLTFYTAVLVKDIALQFSLTEANIETLVNEYSGTWFSDFIDDPDGTTTARTWTNKETDYKPVYRLINRIVILSEILGFEKIIGDDNLEKQSLAYGIETEISPISKDVPGTEPFYWLKSNYTAITASSLAELIWLKGATIQAAILDLPQRDYVNVTPVDFYSWVDDFINDNSNYGPTSFTKVVDLYNSLGDNSPYKALSVHEFTELFKDARLIASTTDDLVEVLNIFENIYHVTQVFKIKAADAWGWVWTGSMTATTIDYNMSADVKRAIHSTYSSFNTWSDVIVPVQNGLRSRMRDAFVGYYIAKRGFTDANRIYDYYLLDTQMAPCMKTSRIVQAIASVQLLVHRGLLNLEPNMFLDEDDKQEWQWRKNYRVWQANRKVFLYPENWIEPSLRKNKTELFKAAEDFLQQDEVNDRNCEQAYNTYLTGLNDVSHLDVRAIYVDDPKADLSSGGGKVYNNNRDEIYHVFARNWNPPHTYYHRKFEDGVWQGWEKMDVEIESDHLIPVMFNRKMYLFFPIFKEKIYEIKGPKPEDSTFHKYYEITLAYTKYDFGKWSQKKIFKEKFLATPYAFTSFNPDEGEVNAQLVASFANKFWDHDGYRTILGNHFYSLWFDYGMAPVSMNKKDFYFWAENTTDGRLRIHLRRALDIDYFTKLDEKYTEFAFEPDFVLNPVDERLSFEADPDSYSLTTGATMFLARPYMTTPFYQQIKHGQTTTKPNWPTITSPAKLFAKVAPNSSADGTYPLLNSASGYLLTFPQQFKHSYHKQPFFFNHSLRSYFFRATNNNNTINTL